MNEELDSIGKLRLRALALLAIVAVASGVVGAALDREVLVGHASRPSEREPPRPNQGIISRDIPAAFRNIDLTAEQRGQLRLIVAKYQPVADSVMRSVGPRVAALDLRMRQEAMCIL